MLTNPGSPVCGLTRWMGPLPELLFRMLTVPLHSLEEVPGCSGESQKESDLDIIIQRRLFGILRHELDGNCTWRRLPTTNHGWESCSGKRGTPPRRSTKWEHAGSGRSGPDAPGHLV